MYIPKLFQMAEDEYAGFIQSFPLALLADANGNAMTHCPLMYLPDSHQLIGHLAKGNAILSALESDPDITVMFTRHQGYISASWYSNDQEVPTWNYSSLEVSGKVTLVNDDQALEILTLLTDQFETSVGGNWTIKKLTDNKRQAMLKGIQAFYIDINHWQGKAKLSQNKTQDVKEELLQHIKQQATSNYKELAGDMSHD